MEENIQKKPGFATLIGRPNVGRSTLVNHLIGQEIVITSDEPQTTRNKIQTVYTDDRGQIIFLDTPGIHKTENKPGGYMMSVVKHALKEVDVILQLVEPTIFIGAGERHITEQLKNIETPITLVINETDTVKNQGEILTFVAAYKGVCDFAEIVSLSALKDKNTDLLTELVFKYLSYGPQFYDEDTVTDQPMRQIAPELIREKTLRPLNDEIPHGIAVTIERAKERKDSLIDIEAGIICERESHKGVIISKGGSILKRVGIGAKKEIEGMMNTQVNLQLWVRIREKWWGNELYMRSYNYSRKGV